MLLRTRCTIVYKMYYFVQDVLLCTRCTIVYKMYSHVLDVPLGQDKINIRFLLHENIIYGRYIGKLFCVDVPL